MNSAQLISLLQSYQKTCSPSKSETAQLFLRFLNEYPDDFWKRSHMHPGHVTISAWVVSPDKKHVLMMHHRGVDKWVQLGGHIDPPDTDVYAVALREVLEECGLTGKLMSADIFDIGHHVIPLRPSKGEGEHEHFDVRFIVSVPFEPPHKEDHSAVAMQWIPLEKMDSLTQTGEIETMIEKTKSL